MLIQSAHVPASYDIHNMNVCFSLTCHWLLIRTDSYQEDLSANDTRCACDF